MASRAQSGYYSAPSRSRYYRTVVLIPLRPVIILRDDGNAIRKAVSIDGKRRVALRSTRDTWVHLDIDLYGLISTDKLPRRGEEGFPSLGAGRRNGIPRSSLSYIL